MVGHSSEQVFRFDSKTLSEFLDMGGAELRGALVAQVCLDLDRCCGLLVFALSQPEAEHDSVGIGKAAHEIKGIAATLGALTLVELARQVEQACQEQDTAGLTQLVTRLAAEGKSTSNALAALVPAG